MYLIKFYLDGRLDNCYVVSIEEKREKLANAVDILTNLLGARFSYKVRKINA